MTTLSLRLPESLHDNLRELARKEGISMNQFISTAVAEKIAALMADDYIRTRARRASRADFDAALGRVPDTEPIPGDEA